jgi:hypothetical protein
VNAQAATLRHAVVPRSDPLTDTLPGDVFKLYLAAALLPGAWKLVERTSKR